MKIWVSSVVAVGVLLGVTGVAATQSNQSPSSAAPPPLNSSAPIDIRDLINSLTVVTELPSVDGYERSCSQGKGCSFGPAWTDYYDGPASKNGCDTRNDVLNSQLADVVHKPGTHGCKVLSGTLHDPYTGTPVSFTSSRPQEVQIDHLFPLGRAYRAGAASWPASKRISFANDVELNLLAVSGKENQSKSDSGLDTWTPKSPAFGCEYVQRYLTVAQHYQLSVTQREIAVAGATCGT